MPFGPGDPTFPTPTWPAYQHFANGDCSGLRGYLDSQGESGSRWEAMVAVCAAAVEGHQDQWEAAAAAAAPSLGYGCLDEVVAGLLDRAFAWHQRHPGRKPAVRFQKVAGETVCGQKANKENQAETDPPAESDPPPTDPPPPSDPPPPTDPPPETTG